ncbi:MAG: YdiU family protein [Oceanobacter sp.]
MKQRLTLDELTLQNDYATLPESFYHQTGPMPLPDPQVISINRRVADLLQLHPCKLDPDHLASWMGGHSQPQGAHPLAMKYAGHQFGGYNPQLGDGRGLLLGEQNVDGQLWDWHLKGAGQTRYSRSGDGRAVLRSSIREYLVGEALSALNIPSTRALAVCVTSQKVRREMVEHAATILRITPCHVRFGHFEHFYYTRQHDALKQLADYSLKRFFPDCQEAEQPYLAMFEQVVQRSAALVAGWQAYGFLHGVMNTDNMSLIGEAFDHGPFAFIDRWKENAVYNHTDDSGRYAFDQQPDIMHWNLSALAQALTPLIPIEDLKAALATFEEHFKAAWLARMRNRLGLATVQPQDEELIKQWRALLAQHQMDFTPLYRALSLAQPDSPHASNELDETELLLWQTELQDWLVLYRQRLQQETRPASERRQAMLATNPVYILRTHLAQEIIRAAEQGDYQPLNQWLAVLQNPFTPVEGLERWQRAPQDQGFVMLSCSS